LTEVGVARVSFAGGVHRAMLAWLRGRLDEIVAGQQPF
jgi:2-methylisocitrate lyase-like PEP mutase family enzyme